MQFNLNYETNFFIDERRQRYIDSMLETKFFHEENGFIISREFLSKERPSKKYRNGYNKNRERYYDIVLNMYEKYSLSCSNILEVGAGSGKFAKRFIERFKPLNYCACDFSKGLCNTIKDNLRDISSSSTISILKKNINDITDKKLKNFDCIISLQVFEHVFKDKEFIRKIPSGCPVLFSVPVFHAYNHVRAFLTPDSVAHRYRKLLKIEEIEEMMIRENKTKKCDRHYYPQMWVAISKRL